MQTRSLGPDRLQVSALGLGGRRLSDNHTETRDDDARAQALVDHAIERGLTLIDSADGYAEGANEPLFGRILADGRRDKVVLCSKFGFITKPDGSRGVNGRPDYAIAACADDVRRAAGTHPNLDDNLAAADIRLGADEMARIHAIYPRGHGAASPAQR